MSIYQTLKHDHEKLKKILEELINLENEDQYRTTLIEDLGNQLIPHIRAEESIFYNTLRAVNADKKLLYHAFQEHIEIEGLFRTLQVLDKFKLHWLPTAIKLKNLMNQHIENEEMDLFHEGKNAFTKDESDLLDTSFQDLKLKVENDGILKNTFEIVFNLLPPRMSDKLSNFVKRTE